MPLVSVSDLTHEIRTESKKLTASDRVSLLAEPGVAAVLRADEYTLRFTIGSQFDESTVLATVQAWMSTNSVS